MYSKERIREAGGIIRRIAQEEGIPEKQVRADMERAMNQARNNPDPLVQARWASFRYAGQEPTVEEFILWSADMAWAELHGL